MTTKISGIHERSISGNCPHCGRSMTIHYGLNRCPHCRYIFKSSFKVK